MKLPNGQNAIIDERKLHEYVLNVSHPVGRHHAILFRDLLGITAASCDPLRTALFEAATGSDATPGKDSPFGKKWEIRFSMPGHRGSHTVLSVWLVEVETGRPRLITCYVE